MPSSPFPSLDLSRLLWMGFYQRMPVVPLRRSAETWPQLWERYQRMPVVLSFAAASLLCTGLEGAGRASGQRLQAHGPARLIELVETFLAVGNGRSETFCSTLELPHPCGSAGWR